MCIQRMNTVYSWDPLWYVPAEYNFFFVIRSRCLEYPISATQIVDSFPPIRPFIDKEASLIARYISPASSLSPTSPPSLAREVSQFVSNRRAERKIISRPTNHPIREAVRESNTDTCICIRLKAWILVFDSWIHCIVHHYARCNARAIEFSKRRNQMIRKVNST